MEHLTYLLSLRRPDELHALEENKANRLKQPMERQISPEDLKKTLKSRLVAGFLGTASACF